MGDADETTRQYFDSLALRSKNLRGATLKIYLKAKQAYIYHYNIYVISFICRVSESLFGQAIKSNIDKQTMGKIVIL